MEDGSNQSWPRPPAPCFRGGPDRGSVCRRHGKRRRHAARGEMLYQGCQDCHSIEKNDVGPMHKDVVGRTAGTVPGYNYSAALGTQRSYGPRKTSTNG